MLHRPHVAKLWGVLQQLLTIRIPLCLPELLHRKQMARVIFLTKEVVRLLLLLLAVGNLLHHQRPERDVGREFRLRGPLQHQRLHRVPATTLQHPRRDGNPSALLQRLRHIQEGRARERGGVLFNCITGCVQRLLQLVWLLILIVRLVRLCRCLAKRMVDLGKRLLLRRVEPVIHRLLICLFHTRILRPRNDLILTSEDAAGCKARQLNRRRHLLVPLGG
mmetsp:Transcript_10859/g.26636  ORF Transcript_10859/g.26636 Transcript_10859/m.26636 type:complete len:220 (+) Transcript_10859:1059-1718(+)